MSLTKGLARAGRALCFAILAGVACSRGNAELATVASTTTASLTDATMISDPLELVPGAPVAAHGPLKNIAIANDGNVHLLVWANDSARLSAMRIRVSDGALLDPTLIPLKPDPAPCLYVSSKPAVAFAAGVFLVAWADGFDICALRVRPDGIVVDKVPWIVAHSSHPEAPAVSALGGTFLVAWADDRHSPPNPLLPPNATTSIRGARVRASDGVGLDGDGFVISTGSAMQKYPAVANDGSGFFVAWSEVTAPGRVLGARIRSSDAAVLDPAGIPLSTAAVGPPALAWNGSHMLVVWDLAGNLFGRRVSPNDGSVVEAEPVLLQAGIGSSSGASDPVVGHDGSHFVVAWRGGTASMRDRTRLLAARFDHSLRAVGVPMVLDEDPLYFPSSTTQAISTAGGKHLIAWNRWPPGVANDSGQYVSMTVQAAMVDGASGAAMLPATLVSRQAPRQSRPSASFDGSQHLVVWQEWNGSHFEVRGARLRARDGALLDPTDIPIAIAAADNQTYPLTASNGQNHLVVWWDGQRLRGLRVRGSDGALLDKPALSLPLVPGAWSYDSPRFGVASDGQDYLIVAGEGGGSFDRPINVSSLRIRGSDGAILDATPRLVLAPSPEIRYLSLAFAQSHYLLSWLGQEGGPGKLVVSAQRVGKDGAAVGAPLAIERGASGFGYTWVAATPDAAVVFWTDIGQIRARRVRMDDGALLDAGATSLLFHDGSSGRNTFAAGFDGEHLLVATFQVKPGELRVQRMDIKGTWLDPTGQILLPATTWARLDVALSPSLDHRSLLISSDFDSAPGRSTERLRFRWLGPAFVPSAPPVDAGPPPAPVDAGPPPAPVDAGPAPAPVDAGPPAVPVDAGPPAVPVDAGPPPAPVDAGPPPAPVDAGPPSRLDAAVPPPVDAGPAPIEAHPADACGDCSDSAPTAVDGSTSDVAADAVAVDGDRADATDGAVAHDAGSNGDNANDSDDQAGCSCSVDARPASRPGLALLFVPLAVAIRRRDRRGRRSLR